jgi:hypothetical protein
MRFRFAFFALARMSSFPKGSFAQGNLEPNLGKQANPAAGFDEEIQAMRPVTFSVARTYEEHGSDRIIYAMTQ